MVGLDVDVVNHFCVNDFYSLIENTLGTAPERIGKQPKFLMVFRCTEPMVKQKTGIYEIDGQDCAVELLCEGQQFVASGIHPDTQRKYKWPHDSLIDVPASELTEVTPEAFKQFLASASRILSNYGPLKGRVSERSAPPKSGLMLTELEGKIEEVRAALTYIPNDNEHYDDWVHTIHAIKGALGEDGRDLAHEWSGLSGKYEAGETDRLWNSIKRVEHIGAGSLFHWASEYGFNLREERTPKFEGPAQLITVEERKPNEILCASEIVGPLPERKWLLDQWFPSRAVSALFGQGGVGKTLLTQQLANCVATGSNFLGISTRKMPVLCVFCEDDALEISRRQLRINDWLGVNEIVGRGPDDLYIWPRVGEDNILVTFPSQGEAKAGKFYKQLYDKAEELRGDADEILLIVDTAADVFGGNEVIRREVNTFIKTYLGSFCIGLNASVLMLAHPSLSGLSSGSGLSGSTAWENAVRARAYFSRDDADNDDVRTLSRKKSNYSSSGQSTDMTLLWENGVYVLPTEQSQIDRIEARALKNKIVDAIAAACREGAPFKQRSGRKLLDVLPTLLNERRKFIVKAVTELELEGAIVHESRVGYRVANYTGGS